MQCVKAGLHNAYPEGTMQINMIRTEFIWENNMKKICLTRFGLDGKGLCMPIKELNYVGHRSLIKTSLSKIKLNASELCI